MMHLSSSLPAAFVANCSAMTMTSRQGLARTSHNPKLWSAVTWGPWVKSRPQSAPPYPRSQTQKPATSQTRCQHWSTNNYLHDVIKSTDLVGMCRDPSNLIDRVNLKYLPWPRWIGPDFCPFQSPVDNLPVGFSSVTKRYGNCRRTRGQRCNFACSWGWKKPNFGTLGRHWRRWCDPNSR